MPSTKGNNYSESDIQAWGPDDVSNWLTQHKLDFCIDEFKSLQIDGQRLLLLTWDEFKTLECLSDEKKKKLFKKSLSTLPGRGTSKSKKFGGKKNTKNPAPLPLKTSLPPPSKGPPPPLPSSNEGVPALPPRPPKFMPSPPFPSNPPPLPSNPPPMMAAPPPPTSMRPPINNIHYHQQELIEEESEEIYDAVPDQDNEPFDEEIYDDGNFDDDEDSFDDDNEVDERPPVNQIQSTQTGNSKELFALKAKFFAHGIGNIGTLEHGGSGPGYPLDDDDDDGDIYDVPPDMENQWLPQGGHPPPPPSGPPPGGYPPPPEDPPPDEGFDDEIYDLPPDMDQGHTHPPPPMAPPPVDEFGYGEGDELYDIADPEDLISGGPNPPPNIPHPPTSMPRPPMAPPTEDVGGEEIYDCMEELEEPPNAGMNFGMKTSGIGMMKPPLMRGPISSPPTETQIPPPITRPPMRAPPTGNAANSVQQTKLQSTSGLTPPPRPSSSSKPTEGFHEVQLKKLNESTNQPPPLRPSSGSKPTAPSDQAPPPPPPPPTVKEEEEESGSGDSEGLAGQLALMKKKLRSNSNASPSTTPPIERKSNNTPSANKPVAPNTNDLAASIALARQKLRDRETSEPAKKELEKPPSHRDTNNLPSANKLNTKPVPQDAKPVPLRNKPVPLNTKPVPQDTKPVSQDTKPIPQDTKPIPLRNKPVPQGTKPALKEKPSVSDKRPPIAPKSNKIASLMGNFQKEESQLEAPPPAKGLPRKNIELDRSPMTGRKVDRKQSVKELTQRYSSSDEDHPVSPQHKPPKPPRPPSNIIDTPPTPPPITPTSGGTNPALNIFKRKQLESAPENAPPPIFNKKVPPPPIISSNASSEPPIVTTPPPELPKRPALIPSEAPSPIKDTPRPSREPMPPPIKNTSRPPLPPPNDIMSSSKGPMNVPSDATPPPLPNRPPGIIQETTRPPLRPPINEEPSLPPRNVPLPPTQEPALPPRNAPLPPTQEMEVPKEPPRPTRVHQTGSPVGQSWYHARLDRKNSELKIKRYSKDGTFIVRDNTKTQGEYSLSLFYEGGVKHLRIRKRNDGQFVLGEEKLDEVAFSDVVELVNFYKVEPVVLKSGGSTPLKYECPH